ncbi:MAG: M15 family metallopeptidase [Terrimicrobiaceae bacterium]|nr:M15 family metallopeptidase [Terrimicrobiaceae bacterium]
MARYRGRMHRIFFCAILLGNAAVSAADVEHRLVNVNTIYPPMLQEIRYATTYNFTGYRLYPFPAAWVHADVAAALQKVQEELASEGLGLKIYDGYRPLSVQARMWAILPDERYVSDPAKSKGRHTRGVAVDVTLVDRLGNELPMPTPFDDFTTRAHRDSPKWTEEQRRNSQKLEAVMTKYGFLAFHFEWWHYDFAGWEKYPPLDISFEDLARGVQTATAVP